MIVLAEELAERGYIVTLFAPSLICDWLRSSRVSFIAWESMMDSRIVDAMANRVLSLFRGLPQQTILAGERQLLACLVDLYSQMFNLYYLFFASTKIDLAVVDRALVPAMDAADACGVKYMVSSYLTGYFGSSARWHPKFGSPYTNDMTLLERVLNELWPVRAFVSLVPAWCRLCHARWRIGIHPFTDPFRSKTVIISSSRRLDPWVNTVDTVHVVGPILRDHITPLEADLRNWMDEMSSREIVYVSFGTLAVPNRSQAAMIVKALSDLRFAVLWSLPESGRSMLPKDLPPLFRLETFLSQRAVLSHPGVKVFVSHCGANSVLDALCYGKPMLGIPFFGDQYYNSARIVDLGIGLRLNKNKMTARQISSMMMELLRMQHYQERGRAFAEELRFETGRLNAAAIVEQILASE